MGGSRLWIHGKADTGIVRAANKLWRRESCWKDIAKLRSMAFRLKNARSFVEQTLKVQTGAGQNGLPWNYRKINYCHHLEREGELLKRGFLPGFGLNELWLAGGAKKKSTFCFPISSPVQWPTPATFLPHLLTAILAGILISVPAARVAKRGGRTGSQVSRKRPKKAVRRR